MKNDKLAKLRERLDELKDWQEEIHVMALGIERILVDKNSNLDKLDRLVTQLVNHTK